MCGYGWDKSKFTLASLLWFVWGPRPHFHAHAQWANPWWRSQSTWQGSVQQSDPRLGYHNLHPCPRRLQEINHYYWLLFVTGFGLLERLRQISICRSVIQPGKPGLFWVEADAKKMWQDRLEHLPSVMHGPMESKHLQYWHAGVCFKRNFVHS